MLYITSYAMFTDYEVAQEYVGCYLTINGHREPIRCGRVRENPTPSAFDDFYVTDIQLTQNQYSIALTGLLVYVGDSSIEGGFFVEYQLMTGGEIVYASKAPVISGILTTGDSVRFNDLIPELAVPTSRLEVNILGVSK